MKIHHDAHREMVRLFQEGASMREIGISFSVSRQRVSQIVRRAGVNDARTRYEGAEGWNPCDYTRRNRQKET